jgi:hypothetical protein
VRATVSRLVVTVDAPAEIVESVVRGELGRRRAKARIQTFVPILTERAAGTDSGIVRRPDRTDRPRAQERGRRSIVASALPWVPHSTQRTTRAGPWCRRQSQQRNRAPDTTRRR